MGKSRGSKIAFYSAYAMMFFGGVIAGISSQKGLTFLSSLATLLTVLAGVFVVAWIFKYQFARDAALKTVVATNGKRHEVTIRSSDARRIVKVWAEESGYSMHSESESKVVFSKGGVLFVPIFASYSFDSSKLEMWIQANGQSISIFDGPIISIPHKIARRDFEKLVSLFDERFSGKRSHAGG